jgi:hypothetical protein
MDSKQLLLAYGGLDKSQASEFIRQALSQLLASMQDEERGELILGLFGGSERDKVASMVHL